MNPVPTPKPSSRDYALTLLDRTPLPGWRVNRLRKKIAPPTDPRDLGLAEQIRVGVIKNFGLLEFLLDHYAKRSDRIEALVRKIIVVGLYQLRFLTRIPASAAVDEAVEQARRLGHPHAAGFVNAVLRRATREPDVPLPRLEDDPQRYAWIVLSHPAEFFQKLVELLGVEQAIQFCEHDNIEPPTIVRLFRARTLDDLKVERINVTPHEQPGMYVAEHAKRATFANWASQGIAQVQDPTAAGVVDHLDLQPAQQVLDRCAGLGTKTMQIRDIVGDDGWVMAVDPSEPRCKGLRALLKARTIENVAVVQTPLLRQVVEIKPRSFDRILVDVPCSNSGVLARRPEARYAQMPEALESLATLQDQIMDDTADYLRPGGLMIYSTCSVWPQENEQRVERFIQSHHDYEQVDSPHVTLPSLSTNPASYHDGGFFAVLRRRG
jgi:16S rRNA (cytosine967-C5)-methyltransferase